MARGHKIEQNAQLEPVDDGSSEVRRTLAKKHTCAVGVKISLCDKDSWQQIRQHRNLIGYELDDVVSDGNADYEYYLLEWSGNQKVTWSEEMVKFKQG